MRPNGTQSATKTDRIRDLLGHGMTSGEVIVRGYAPGTVYGVLAVSNNGTVFGPERRERSAVASSLG